MELKQFEHLFRLYSPRLKRYAAVILHDEAAADDLVQDVFFQLWQSRWQPESEKNTGSWLFTLLRNKCLNLLKHKIVEEKYILQSARYETEELYHISFMGASGFVSTDEKLMTELEVIIAEMPPKCQTAFRLKWFEGKKIREIAELMDISTTMVDKHLARGIEIVRQKLNPDLFVFLFFKLPGH
jgi:RNA polymerase sigma-70 factor (ECF subfamily)